MPGKGRKHGELKGETEQANRLASWLRRLTQGLTQRQLEERFGTGRTTWGEYLSGARLIPADQLAKLVDGLVPEPRMRARELERARTLWRAAEDASHGRIPLEHPAPTGRLPPGNQPYHRLAEAREHQLRAERALHKAQQMVLVLLNMVSLLQSQCETLVAERDRAVAAARSEVVADVQRALDEVERELAEASQDLGRARRARLAAEQIKVAAHQVVETCRRAVDGLATSTRPPSYAAVRDRIAEALDEQEDQLEDLSGTADGNEQAEEPMAFRSDRSDSANVSDTSDQVKSPTLIRATVPDYADSSGNTNYGISVDGTDDAPRRRAFGGLFGLLRRQGSSRRDREYEAMAETVEQMLEERRMFVADASHQLRNPLAALMLRLDLLALELPEEHEEVVGVRAEGRRMARVLDDLLDLALAEHAVSQAEQSDVSGLVRDRVTAWLPTAEQRDVALRLAGPPSVHGWIDPIGFASALDVVLDNALKFTKAGDDVLVLVERRTHGVAVRVADTGAGLTDDELGRVGDRFWRSQRHATVPGSGLGLATAQALLHSAHASMEFAHNYPRGLSVTLSLPKDEAGT